MVPSEELLLDVLARWVLYDVEHRKEAAPQLFSHVRYRYIDDNRLKQVRLSRYCCQIDFQVTHYDTLDKEQTSKV